MSDSELMRWRAWVSIPTGRGGVVRGGEEFIAPANDPRCAGGRAKLLGPVAVREPSPETAAAIASALEGAPAETATADPADGGADPTPEPDGDPDPSTEEPAEAPAAPRARANRGNRAPE